MSSISWNTLCLSSWFSKTASITKSTPAKAAGSAAGVMRASSSGRLLRWSAPRVPLASSFGVALATFGGGQFDVLENDVVAGFRLTVDDSGAHHARAQNADLLDRRLAMPRDAIHHR